MTIHSLRSRLSTMSCPLFIRFIIVCSINMNVHLQHSYMGIRGILFRSYKHQIILDDLCNSSKLLRGNLKILFISCACGENSKYSFYYLKIRMGK